MDGVLKDAGIPSLIQRAAGFDAPDFLAAGPRDVLVPGSLLGEAKQIPRTRYMRTSENSPSRHLSE